MAPPVQIERSSVARGDGAHLDHPVGAHRGGDVQARDLALGELAAHVDIGNYRLACDGVHDGAGDGQRRRGRAGRWLSCTAGEQGGEEEKG